MQVTGRKMILAKRMKSLHSGEELPIQDLGGSAIGPWAGTTSGLHISPNLVDGAVKTQEALLGACPNYHTHI